MDRLQNREFETYERMYRALRGEPGASSAPPPCLGVDEARAVLIALVDHARNHPLRSREQLARLLRRASPVHDAENGLSLDGEPVDVGRPVVRIG